MVPTPVAPKPKLPRRARASSRFGRAVLLLAAGSSLAMLLLNVLNREFYSGDEGFYGVTSLNLLHSPKYWLRPSFYPEGDFGTDQDAFAHPPFNSYCYALPLWVSSGSRPSVETVDALAFILLLGFSYRLLSRYDTRAGGFAVLLLVASPAILILYSQLEAEPLLTTFGIMSLYCALRAGFAPGQRRFFFLGGLCLGMAFALKLWLVGPFGLAVAVVLVPAAGADLRSLKPASLGAFVLGAILPAGLHLAAIAWWYPGDLSFWLRNIYFGFFTGAGISGTKTGGSGLPLEWIHPVWYYGAVLYRDHFFLLPLLLLGYPMLFCDKGLDRRLLRALLAGIAGLLPLSLVKVKEPLYILSCTILLYLLAGCCLAGVARRLESGRRIPLWSWRLTSLVTCAFLAFVLVAFSRHRMPDKISPAFALAHTAVLAFVLLALGWLRWHGLVGVGTARSQLSFSNSPGANEDEAGPSPIAALSASAQSSAPSDPSRADSARQFQWTLYAVCALAVVALYSQQWVSRVPRDRTIARIAEPYLAATAPGVPSFIASNYKCYQFYLFRRGCYWHEVPLKETPERVMANPGFARVRAFILDPDALSDPDIARWLPWLKSHAQDKTKDLDAQLGRVSGWRVFVR